MRQGNRRFLALAIALLGVPGSGAPSDTRPPNIVLLLADDLGFSDLAPYGSEIETPNLERLAAEGVRFSSYHTAASCAPTRAMLMTGVDSHRNGVPDMPEALPYGYLDRPRYFSAPSLKPRVRRARSDLTLPFNSGPGLWR